MNIQIFDLGGMNMFDKFKKTQIPFVSDYPILTPPDEVVNPIIPEIDEMVYSIIRKNNSVASDKLFEVARAEIISRENSSFDKRLAKQERIENNLNARSKQLEAKNKRIDEYIEKINEDSLF